MTAPKPCPKCEAATWWTEPDKDGWRAYKGARAEQDAEAAHDRGEHKEAP